MIASLIFLSVQLIQKQCLHEEVLGFYPAPSSSLQSLLKDKKDLISHLLMPGKKLELGDLVCHPAGFKVSYFYVVSDLKNAAIFVECSGGPEHISHWD